MPGALLPVFDTSLLAWAIAAQVSPGVRLTESVGVPLVLSIGGVPGTLSLGTSPVPSVGIPTLSMWTLGVSGAARWSEESQEVSRKAAATNAPARKRGFGSAASGA
jgi:hypothetical protein